MEARIPCFPDNILELIIVSRWLFIVEGVLSIGIAVVRWLIMPDNAMNAKFLNEEDKAIMSLRMKKHARYTALNEHFDKSEVWKCFKDPKIYMSGLIQFFGDVISLGSSTFLPIIIKYNGFKTIETQLLLIPVYTWGTAVYIIVSFWSDKVQSRVKFMISGAISCMIAYALLVGVKQSLRGVLYLSLFFLNPGVYVSLTQYSGLPENENQLLIHLDHARYELHLDAEQPRGILQACDRDRNKHDMTMENSAGLIVSDQKNISAVFVPD